MVAKAMVPKLRFKEDDAIREREWSRDSIGNLFNVVSGGTPSRANQEFFQNGKHAWVRTTDLNNGFITTTSECLTDIALRENKIKILPEGTVVVAMYGGFNQIGRTGLLISPSAINQALSAILPNPNIFVPYFLLSYLNYKVDAWKEFAASSRKDPNITKEDVKSFELIFPDIKEQTKIANFLTAVDSKISQLTKKHDLLTLYKKGVIQKIFSQEVRFKDDEGRVFPDWEEKRLGEIANLFKGKGISKADIDKDGAHPCIRYGELYTEYGEAIRNIQSHTNLDPNDHVLSAINDVIIPASGETQIDIATASCVLVGGVILGGDLNIIRAASNQAFDGIFLSYFLNTKKKLDIAKLAQGNSVVHLYASQLKGLMIYLPTLDEQTKIANFLTAIDDKITNIISRLEAAKEYKQGLLQQMFV
jgi:type I restriction enzyme S subunit